MAKKPEKFALRVIKGGFAPADEHTRAKLRERKYQIDDVVFADIRKARNPKFMRLAHALGKLVADNIDSFNGMDAHRVLKRLQLEANIGCDEVAYRLAGMDVVQRIPQSLSFESMDQDEFHDVMRGICRHLAEHYWEGMTEEQIAEMAERMVDE